jgi:hypothetical protein
VKVLCHPNFQFQAYITFASLTLDKPMARETLKMVAAKFQNAQGWSFEQQLSLSIVSKITLLSS